MGAATGVAESAVGLTRTERRGALRVIEGRRIPRMTIVVTIPATIVRVAVIAP